METGKRIAAALLSAVVAAGCVVPTVAAVEPAMPVLQETLVQSMETVEPSVLAETSDLVVTTAEAKQAADAVWEADSYSAAKSHVADSAYSACRIEASRICSLLTL